MVRRVSAQEARRRFAEILGQVRFGKEPVVIEKGGQEYVAVVPLEDFVWMQKEREARFRALEQLWEKTAADVDPEEVERRVAEELRAVRHERRRAQSSNG